MPNMSGFEFLSVLRRRFRTFRSWRSGAYECGEAVPGGIIADGFYAKAHHHPEDLLSTVADLIRSSAARAKSHQQQSAPVWIPRNGKELARGAVHRGDVYECLRSFPLSVPGESLPEI